MGQNCLLTTLLVITVITVINGQHYDLLQGIQQWFQPHQGNGEQHSGATRNLNTNNKKKPNEQQTNNDFKTKPINQYDYIFATTQKPNRKTTKSNSSHNNSNKNQHNVNPFEVTTKSNLNRTTSINSNYKTTTENVYKNNLNYNRPVTENVHKKENYEINNEQNASFNNRRIDNVRRYDYARTNNNNNWNNTTERGNTDTDSTNYPKSNRNPNVIGVHNPYLNTDLNPETPNFANNHKTNLENKNRRINNFDNTGLEFSNRGNLNTEGSYNPNNNIRRNANGWANTDNWAFVYPTDPPLTNYYFQQNQPPITNKPVSNDRNNFNFNGPVSGGSTEQAPQQPEVIIGPDEDDMSPREKKRYEDLAENVCNNYKALTVKKISALPLIPSPQPSVVNVSDCIPINVPLIIGGDVVNIREYPHMVLIGWTKLSVPGYSWKCGGSLISNQYILTAGHCTYHDKDYNVISGSPTAVQLGSSFIDDSGAIVVKISTIVRHPKYKQSRAYHDIALVKMVSKVTFSEVIRPACLGVPPPEGRPIIATGWGRTEFGEHSEQLRSVSLPIWNLQECQDIWGTSRKLPVGVTRESHLCAGAKQGGQDTCQGDSGGPAQIQDGCMWRVVGVTSYGRACAAAYTPALYAVVPRAFIAAQAFTQQ